MTDIPPVKPGTDEDGHEKDDNGHDDCACEVDRFTVATVSHIETDVDPNTGLVTVTKHAWFVAYFRQNDCCDCCEFRQYVYGSCVVNGTAVSPPGFVMVPLPVPPYGFIPPQEDHDEAGQHYGHRDEPGDDINDRYYPDRADGCIYLGRDEPGIHDWPPGNTYSIELHFIDVIIDGCNDDAVVAGPEYWDFVASGTT